ncbi:MAG TPA: carboxypeptidase-like regulatory domain-containing protein [Dongiaceae bacterium]|jgi:hypothetical protein|nr:carboxypeptidase-like regulatory domain-containing protein [Dongiaceae bacterium]
MFTRFYTHFCLVLTLLVWAGCQRNPAGQAGESRQPNPSGKVFQISGTITRPDDGCTQAVVVLCDGISGEPLCRQTLQPFTTMMQTTNSERALEWVLAGPDATGRFQFTNLPAGHYIVVAQAWNAPAAVTNFFFQNGKVLGDTVHLLGRAEVVVPSPEATAVALKTPGNRTLRFDQQFPNDGGFLMLSTQPQRGDAILCWYGWGTNFIRHIVGFNGMPGGRTVVHGLPAGNLYASIFANDDAPGFGSVRIRPDEAEPVKMPIVAGWSDGYKIPPPDLVWLVDLLETNKFSKPALWGFVTNLVPDIQQNHPRIFKDNNTWEIMQVLQPHWEKEITLPNGQKTRVMDFLTALGYARLSDKSQN